MNLPHQLTVVLKSDMLPSLHLSLATTRPLPEPYFKMNTLLGNKLINSFLLFWGQKGSWGERQKKVGRRLKVQGNNSAVHFTPGEALRSV